MSPTFLSSFDLSEFVPFPFITYPPRPLTFYLHSPSAPDLLVLIAIGLTQVETRGQGYPWMQTMWVSLLGHWEGWERANNELGEANKISSIWTFLACGTYYSSDPLFALAFMCKILSSFVSLFLKLLFLKRAECSEYVIYADYYLKTFIIYTLTRLYTGKFYAFPSLLDDSLPEGQSESISLQ